MRNTCFFNMSTLRKKELNMTFSKISENGTVSTIGLHSLPEGIYRIQLDKFIINSLESNELIITTRDLEKLYGIMLKWGNHHHFIGGYD